MYSEIINVIFFIIKNKHIRQNNLENYIYMLNKIYFLPIKLKILKLTTILGNELKVNVEGLTMKYNMVLSFI